MKVRADKDALADAVAWTAKSLPRRPAQPVLACMMLRAADGQLQLQGFDYEVSHEVATAADVTEPGRALVSGTLLAEIAKSLPNRPIEIATSGPNIELVCGSARFTLPTMPPEDYPALPVMPDSSGTITAVAFAAAVAQVAVAASKDDTVPVLTGVRVEVEGDRLAMLCTDRYRLAVWEGRWRPVDADIKANVLVPARALYDTAKALGSLGGDVSIALTDGSRPGEGMIGLTAGPRRTTSRLFDGTNYPPVRGLFPATRAATALVDVAALMEVVKRVALVAERTTPVQLCFGEDGLVVEAGSSTEARASEAMDATYVGRDLTIAFNPHYLVDGLAQLGASTAAFSFVDAFKPAVVEPAGADGEVIPGYRHLIMPIRAPR